MNVYLCCKKRFLCGTANYSPAHSYPFIVLQFEIQKFFLIVCVLIPILVIWTVGAFMGVAGGVVWGLIGTFITAGSSILFFFTAAVDPGINPWRRFSGHYKHCLWVTYRYKAHFYSNGFLQFEHLEYCKHCYGIRPFGTYHCLDWDQWIRKYYWHSLIFMKCIGERNMHYYIWWYFAEAFKHFFLFIMSCAGMSSNLPSGLIFFLLTIAAFGFNVYMIFDAIKWVINNRINTFQQK